MMKLRSVHDWDFKFLYDLLKERPDYANISHKEMPAWEQHVAFCKGSPYAYWYIITDSDNNKHGTIFLSYLNEIGIAVKKEHQSKGIGTEAVKRLLAKHPGLSYLANIAPQNKDSERLFRKLGFKHVQNTFKLASRPCPVA